MLSMHSVSRDDWFVELRQRHRNGHISTFDVVQTLRNYNFSRAPSVHSNRVWLHHHMLKEQEIQLIMRYVDPDSNGEVTQEELEAAFNSAESDVSMVAEDALRASKILMTFQGYLNSSHVRIVDLFVSADKDKSGAIQMHELRSALGMVQKGAVGRKRAEMAEARQEMKEQKEAERNADMVSRYEAAIEYIRQAEACCALEALHSIKSTTGTTGLRVSDLISRTGTDPHEPMSSSKLEAFLVRSIGKRLGSTLVKQLVTFMDDNGDGMVSLEEISHAIHVLTQHEILVKQVHDKIVKATAKVDAKWGKSSESIGSKKKSHSLRPSQGGSHHGRVATICLKQAEPLLSPEEQLLMMLRTIDKENATWLAEVAARMSSEKSLGGRSVRSEAPRSATDAKSFQTRFQKSCSTPHFPFRLSAGSNMDPAWLSGWDERCQAPLYLSAA
ncbi:unnamed protein product [Chrysoparadoxa australica]